MIFVKLLANHVARVRSHFNRLLLHWELENLQSEIQIDEQRAREEARQQARELADMRAAGKAPLTAAPRLRGDTDNNGSTQSGAQRPSAANYSDDHSSTAENEGGEVSDSLSDSTAASDASDMFHVKELP